MTKRADIAEELDAHLQASADALVREGLTPDAAQAEALRRFGDPQKHLESTWGQAPEARMNRAIGIALVVATVAMAGCLVAMGLQLSRTEQRLDRIVAILAEKSDESHSPASRVPEVPEDSNVVYVDGTCVGRPGVYSLPRAGVLTTSRLVAAAGVDLRPGWWAYVVRSVPDVAEAEAWKAAGQTVWHSQSGTCFQVPLPAPGQPAAWDLALKPGDRVTISARKYSEFPDTAGAGGGSTPSARALDAYGSHNHTVTIVGLVRNPGLYSVARNDFFIETLVATAGGAQPAAQGLMVWRSGPDDWKNVALPEGTQMSTDGRCVAFPLHEPNGLGRCTVRLRNGDTVMVSERFPDFDSVPHVSIDGSLRAAFLNEVFARD